MVKSTSFLGTVASLEMDVQGSNIVVDRHRPRKADIPQPGAMMECAVPPEACLIFDAKTGDRLGRGVS
jgi:hypothetical protein